MLAIAFLGCSGPGASSPPMPAAGSPLMPPAAMAPGMQTVGRTLTLDDLRAEAPDLVSLETALEGFGSGRERTFSARAGKLRSVTVRTLAFASSDTADEYLAWLEAHVDLFIGRAERAGSLPLPGAPTLHRQRPCGCSPKEVLSHLVAWERDAMVLVVIVTGPEDAAATMSFARKLDALVEAQG